ncbi:uncharacterized protein IWZ02DRAFT_47134 [Phyllosticta citriasiana]|uniref:Uncharacterized protein n=1 Tax=Phyllosticta citriasiana TaxID=595635 RepID=A0ABR1KDX0_9PEZI
MSPPARALIAVMAAFVAFTTLWPLLLPLILALASVSSSFLTFVLSPSSPSSLVRLCTHKLVTHTVAKYYVKKVLRAAHAFVVRRETGEWVRWIRRLGDSCAGAACLNDVPFLGPVFDAQNDAGTEARGDGDDELLTLSSALATALDSVRDVVAGAEPPVRLSAAERRRSIDAVVAGCVGECR